MLERKPGIKEFELRWLYGEVKIFCCLLGVSGFCVQGGDPTGTGMGKLTLKKKLPQILNMFKRHITKSIDITNICLKKASMKIGRAHV